MKPVNYGKAILGGIVGALVMSGVGLYVAPMMGLMPMNPADMLAMKMGGPVVGWIGHLAIGSILAIIYTQVRSYIPGPPVVQGALFGIAPWLLAVVVVVPMMMGTPIFMGSMMMSVGSLIGHLMYGAVVGLIYGEGK